MNTHDESMQRPVSISETAADWLLRWHCGDLSVRERFEYLQWLKVSPVHIAETLRMCRLYSWLQGLDLELIKSEHSFDVIQLRPDDPPQERIRVRRASRGRTMARMRGFTAAAAMISVGVGTFNMAWAVVHETSPPLEFLYQRLPLLGTLAPVLISILALAFGAAMGWHAVKRSAMT